MPILPHSPSLAVALVLAVVAPAAHADCIDAAAARHHVNAVVLRAIGWQESRLQPRALGRNANGSVDVGVFQINSVHLAELARYGVDRASLADACVSADVAAWHYRRQVERQGDTWLAVGAYHSRTAARSAWYANRIATILMRWKALPAGLLPFPADRTLAPDAPYSPYSPDTPAGRRRPLPSATPPPPPPPPSSPMPVPVPVPPTPGRSPSQGVDALAFVPSAR